MNHWLVKSEPDEFSIDDLIAEADQQTYWDGIRNYQARNFLREMKPGDQVLFYNSSCKPTGIIGVMEVISLPEADPMAWDKSSAYFDPKSSAENPRWDRVKMQFVSKFNQLIPLSSLKTDPNLSEMHLVQKGTRLSVMPVKKSEFNYILKLSKNN